MSDPKIPDPASLVSRRKFLTVSVATAVVASSVPQANALAAAKVSKAMANYQDLASGSHHCAICVHFRAPHSCEVVRGAINPNGVCRFFKAKSGMRMGRAHPKPTSGGSTGGMGY